MSEEPYELKKLKEGIYFRFHDVDGLIVSIPLEISREFAAKFGLTEVAGGYKGETQTCCIAIINDPNVGVMPYGAWVARWRTNISGILTRSGMEVSPNQVVVSGTITPQSYKVIHDHGYGVDVWRVEEKKQPT